MARNRNRKSRHFAPAGNVAGQVQVCKKWEKWEEELVRSLHAEGKTYRQISQSLPGRTEGACKARAVKKHRTKIMPKCHKRWEDWEDQLLLERHEAGDSLGKISELLSHRTASAVFSRWYSALKSRIEATDPTATKSQHRWNLGEDRLLKSLRESGQSWTEIAREFPDCTVKQCISHWYKMPHPPKDRRWKEWEERLLVSGYYTGLSWKKIAKSIPGRTVYGAKKQWSLHFCLPEQDTPWTSEELSTLEHLRAGGSNWDEINPKIPGHSLNACRMQWYKETEGIQSCRPRRPVDYWSAEETDTLITLYNTIGPRWEEIWKYIPGRTELACKGYFYEFGIKEEGVGDAPSEYWIDYFMSKLHSRTIIPALSPELTP